MSYVGFKKLRAKLSAKDPDAVAASIGRKKYGKKFDEAAHKHVKVPTIMRKKS